MSSFLDWPELNKYIQYVHSVWELCCKQVVTWSTRADKRVWEEICTQYVELKKLDCGVKLKRTYTGIYVNLSNFFFILVEHWPPTQMWIKPSNLDGSTHNMWSDFTTLVLNVGRTWHRFTKQTFPLEVAKWEYILRNYIHFFFFFFYIVVAITLMFFYACNRPV